MKVLTLKKPHVLSAVEHSCEDGKKFLTPLVEKLFPGRKRVIKLTKNDLIKYINRFVKYIERHPDSMLVEFNLYVHVQVFFNDIECEKFPRYSKLPEWYIIRTNDPESIANILLRNPEDN